MDLLQVGGLTCRWQQHSVKPSCLECSTIVETHLRVVVPIEEEEEEYEMDMTLISSEKLHIALFY
jgi:hypothetical protein